MSDFSDHAEPEVPAGCPRSYPTDTCLGAISSFGECPPGKARVWITINGFLKFDYGCCKGCVYSDRCFGEAVFEGDRFEVGNGIANKMVDLGIALKIKDAPVRRMVDDPLSGLLSLNQSQRACYAVLVMEELKLLPKDLPEKEYKAEANRLARELAMDLAIPAPNPFEPPKPPMLRFGDHPAFDRLVRLIISPDLTQGELFADLKQLEADREIPASAWPAEDGAPTERFRTVNLSDPADVASTLAEPESSAPVVAGLGGVASMLTRPDAQALVDAAATVGLPFTLADLELAGRAAEGVLNRTHEAARAQGRAEARQELPASAVTAAADPSDGDAEMDQGKALAELKPSHSTDFTFVNWYGTEYRFALGVQSSAVNVLWNEWERTGLGLHQATIRNAVDAERDSFRMDKAFRKHPAFSTMIQKCGDGKYKLAPPIADKATSARRPKKSAGIPAKALRKPR